MGRTFGTTVTVGGSAVGGLRSMNISGVDVNFIDTTTWGTTGARTFIGGLKDNGTLELGGLADAADAGQDDLIAGGSAAVAVVVTPPGYGAISFNAVIGGYNFDGSDEDGNLMFSATLKVSGDITLPV